MSVCLLAFLAGCGIGGNHNPNTTSPVATVLHPTGKVFGGQQPVVGAQVYLYAAGTSGTGSASSSLLASPGYVTTAADGTFSIGGLYTCPSAGTQVYLLALGGNAGGGVNNSIGFIAGLGPCGNLSSSTFVWMNELTTVATVTALSSYMVDATHVGSASSDTNGLAAAFANINNMVGLSTGITPATTAVGNAIVPQTTIDSLANSLAACINSTNGISCSQLFSAATVNSVTPTNVVQAALNIVQNPTQNVTAIYNLAAAQPPFEPTLSAAPSSWTISVGFPQDVLTFYYNNSRTGVQSAESILTTSNVASNSFGKLRTFPVDGYLFTQPLYTGGMGMPDGAIHDVVYAATLHGSMYAFDADGNNPAQGYLWKVSLVPSGETQVTPSDYFNCGNPSPEGTLLSTPVIDRSMQTLYAVVKTRNTTTNAYIQRLHAISLLDGSEKLGGPVTIAATYTGTGDSSSGGIVSFDSLHENNRAALLLANGTVWIAYASHCDITPYHGWLLGYNEATLAQNAVYNNTPNGTQGGIWMSSGGPASDAAGYIYVVGGNGTYDGNPDLGDAGIKLQPPGTGSTTMTVVDYFAPGNQLMLDDDDLDMGVSEPLLFSDPASGVAPQLMVETDKTGRVYLLNTSHMGTYDSGMLGVDSDDGDLEEFTLGAELWGNFAYFNGTLYAAASTTPLQAYRFTPGTATAAGSFNTTPSSMTTFSAPGSNVTGGLNPVVSASGTANPIVWTSTHSGSNAILYALNATNLANEYYDSTQAASSRDAGPAPVKFTSPVVANGMVFVGGTSSLVVYGLLP